MKYGLLLESSKENDKLCKLLLKKIFVLLEEMIITSYQDLWI